MRNLSFFYRLLCCLLMLPAVPCDAQVEEPTTGEILENFFRDNEQPDETDAQAILENLENLRRHPLDLNTATREDLAGIRLLNELEIENFLVYRSSMGLLLNEYELQAIPEWDLSDIRRIRPFIRVSNELDTRNVSIFDGFYRGENEILLRWGRTDPVNYVSTAEGAPDALAFRFQHNFDTRMRFGFTAENDPGEAFFNKSNKQGFDFYSAHLFIKDLNRTVKILALGDFSARMGQGLLLQTGFSPGKSAETTSVARGGRRIRPYGSFGEAYFLRGAAGTFALGKNWEVTALLSYRKRDGNVVAPVDTLDQEYADAVFTSLQSSGLHRTPSEIADEKAVGEWLGGMTVTHNWKNGQISLNGLYLEYDKPWQPDPAPYRQFGFSGKKLAGASLDYFWRRRNWYAFGEIARSDNGGMAGVNGLLFAADRHVNLALVHRAFARDYQSIYAAPFAETSGAANEQGLYLGTDVRFGRKWQINAYADLWRHPWLRFGVSAPSTGSEYLGRIIWTPSRGVSFYALWQLEIKEKDSNTEGLNGLVDNRRTRFRLHAAYKLSSGVELRSRVERSGFRIADFAGSKGFLAYQEAVIHPIGFPVSGSLRYAIFDTPDYDTRVYTFENDLFSAVSIPAFAGRGARYFVNLTWRVNKWFRLEGRFEQTLQRLAVTDSGRTGKTTAFKLQARFRF